MRSAGLFVAVGQKESGKTKTSYDHYLLPCIQGDIETGAQPRKVLIFDVQDEFPQVKTLPIERISLFSAHSIVEMRRIVPFKYWEHGQEMTPDEKAVIVGHILEHFRRGAILLEDINNYIFDYMPGDIVGKILSQRHKGVDVILHYHSLGAIHKKIWRYINEIRLHKCEDSVIDNKDKYPEKLEMFLIAEHIVNRQYYEGNRYFSLDMVMQKRKIIADVSEQYKDQAIEDYLTSRYRKLITPLLEMRGKENRAIYTAETAWQKEYDRIKETYF